MWHKIRTALSFPISDLCILAQAWVLLLMVDLSLRWMSFRLVQKWLRRGGSFATKHLHSDDAKQVIRYHRLVKLAGNHHLYPMTCLRKALVVKWFIDRKGVLTKLRIGVIRGKNQFSAHAWIEYCHQPVGEQDTIVTEFKPMVMQDA